MAVMGLYLAMKVWSLSRNGGQRLKENNEFLLFMYDGCLFS